MTSYDNKMQPQHATQTQNTHHHHGGGASSLSSGVDLMNPCHCWRIRSIYALPMYDVNKIGMETMGGDRYMVTVIGGQMVLENVTKV
jgi:hypothetical protein